MQIALIAIVVLVPVVAAAIYIVNLRAQGRRFEGEMKKARTRGSKSAKKQPAMRLPPDDPMAKFTLTHAAEGSFESLAFFERIRASRLTSALSPPQVRLRKTDHRQSMN